MDTEEKHVTEQPTPETTETASLNERPNILVCGNAGVGKTSLIRAVTHAGTVPDTVPGPANESKCYETDAVNFIDCAGGVEAGKSIEDYARAVMESIARRRNLSAEEGGVYAVWYCIDGSAGRVQEADRKRIEAAGEKILLVVTKAELMRNEQMESMMDALLDLLPAERIVMVSSRNGSGLKKLLDVTQTRVGKALGGEPEKFRDRWKAYYCNMVTHWGRQTSEEADSFINWAAGRAAAIALVPMPLADVGPLVANEAYMIYRLGAVYGYAVDKTVLTMLAGVVGGSIGGKIAASFLPFLKVPIAAGITYGVGKAAKAYFESDMTLGDGELNEAFDAGREEAGKTDWENQQKKDE